ncbi:unnamed protein product [Dibothriocephalus latus]|uniref:Uncharacterized protein n=1 Tax=Dibothriocephalus latus TaxID=60516 RepID=A0A3P7RY56_DIBLA|nr:unnamed protein product [Dibothriocephalus latus]
METDFVIDETVRTMRISRPIHEVVLLPRGGAAAYPEVDSSLLVNIKKLILDLLLSASIAEEKRLSAAYMEH